MIKKIDSTRKCVLGLYIRPFHIKGRSPSPRLEGYYKSDEEGAVNLVNAKVYDSFELAISDAILNNEQWDLREGEFFAPIPLASEIDALNVEGKPTRDEIAMAATLEEIYEANELDEEIFKRVAKGLIKGSNADQFAFLIREVASVAHEVFENIGDEAYRDARDLAFIASDAIKKRRLGN